MGCWDQDSYLHAWNFASLAHQGQVLHTSDLPYINHIGLVAMEVLAAITLDQERLIDQPDLLVQCALLHDTIEDTAVDYQQLKDHFGENVADGVLALTKNEQLATKALQMQDSLDRILQQPKVVWMVKLADRITNLQPPPPHWDLDKKIYYADEARLILQTLGSANLQLKQRLARKIEQYQVHLL